MLAEAAVDSQAMEDRFSSEGPLAQSLSEKSGRAGGISAPRLSLLHHSNMFGSLAPSKAPPARPVMPAMQVRRAQVEVLQHGS